MAWRNIEIPLFDIPQSMVTDFNVITSNINPTEANIDFDYAADTAIHVIVNSWAAGDSSCGIYCESVDAITCGFVKYINGNTIDTRQNLDINSGYRDVTFVACVDDEQQIGCFATLNRYDEYGTTGVWEFYGTRYRNADTYTVLTGIEVRTYNWSSVPAISGKNGILSLPTLVDTDGNPISGQSASVFSSLPEGSNVRALINGAL